MRDTIFISHATPEDNEFTIWLASRLELLGYKVWIDKKELLGGETFWEIIESAIKINATKFLLVYSKNICYPNSTEIKAGIPTTIRQLYDVFKTPTFYLLDKDKKIIAKKPIEKAKPPIAAAVTKGNLNSRKSRTG